MKKLLIFLTIIILVPVLIGGYFGLIPGISTVFGSDKPKDLGVAYKESDKTSAYEKTKVNLEELPSNTSADKSLVYQGSHEAKVVLSSEEVTAMANNSKWKYNPLSNVQVKFNTDGSAEASGMVSFGAAVNYALALGVSQKDLDAVLAKYPIPKTAFPFYVKLSSGSVTENQLSAEVAEVKLAKIPVPANIVNEFTPGALSFVKSKYLSNESIYVKSLKNEGGRVAFEGRIPDVEKTAR